MARKSDPCIAATAGQTIAGIGHNGAPVVSALSVNDLAKHLFEAIGPRCDTAIPPFECGAPWTGYATDADLKRLGKLQARIIRRERALKELRAERKRIMEKNIKRMRRANGQN